MMRFNANESSGGFTKGRSYYTADSIQIESEAYSCVILDDRGLRHQITSDVPTLVDGDSRISFDVREVSNGNLK